MVSPNRAKLRAASYMETSYPFLLHSTAHAIPPIPAPTTITLNFGGSRVILDFQDAGRVDVAWGNTSISAGCGTMENCRPASAHPGRGEPLLPRADSPWKSRDVQAIDDVHNEDPARNNMVSFYSNGQCFSVISGRGQVRKKLNVNTWRNKSI